MPMFRRTYYATSPDSMQGASNEQLRQRYAVEDLFAADALTLHYTHFERMVVGGAAPARERTALPAQSEPASALGKPLLERRELAAINVGGGEGAISQLR
jgi:4-deoxy-L-threo-5-hexosulose-uronate ketol-isomerase